MNKIYSKINFLNRPSKKTPLNAANLNKMDEAIDGLDNRVVDMNDELAVERARIDNLQTIPGSTTADAALYDINIGYDGKDWGTPGESVRGQIGEVISKIGALSVVDGALCVTFEETE